MRRITFCTFAVLLALSVADGQEAKLSLTRVKGIDGKPWQIKARKLAPELQTFDAPYVLTPGADRPALWYLDGETCVPVTYLPPGKRPAAFEVAASGKECFLTYVTDGVNEFWRLQEDKASQVTLNGKPFSQRARITHGGDSPLIYAGDFEGKTRVYEVLDGAATAVPVDDTDRGTISYAWQVGGILLAAFYLDGTYDFHALKDGKFSPAWSRNGEKDYDRQVDSIRDLRAGDRLFLEITFRDHSTGGWIFDGSKLEAVKPWGTQPVVNAHGAYFIADGALMHADGTVTRKLEGPSPTSLQCRGGSVLAKGEKAAWLVTGAQVTELPATIELVAHVNDSDVLHDAGKLEVYRAGKPGGSIIAPEDFGGVYAAWRSYLLELSAGETPAFRLWNLR
jgi:hypothetical protein